MLTPAPRDPDRGLPSIEFTEKVTPLRVVRKDPSTGLRDLTVKKRIKAIIAPVMKEHGIALEKVTLSNPYGKDHKLTLARGAKTRFYIIELPEWLIDDPNEDNRNAMVALQFLFKPEDRIVVVWIDEDERELAWAYKTTFEKVWRGIHTDCVGWRSLGEAERSAGLERVMMVCDLFKIDEQAPAAVAPPSTPGGGDGDGPDGGDDEDGGAEVRWDDLAKAERELLIEFMDEQASGVGGRDKYFEQLVPLLNLPTNWENELNGLGSSSTANVLRWAFTKGPYPANSASNGRTVAGELLNLLTTQAGGSKSKQIAMLVLRRRLISDQTTLAELKARAGVDG